MSDREPNSGWEMVPLGRFVRKLDRPVPSGSEVVTAFRDGFVGPRSLRREDGFTFSDLEQGYQGVDSGDLVFHGLDGFAGAFGVAQGAGKCSPVYHVLTCGSDDPRFVAYALRVAAVAGLLEIQMPSTRQRAVDFRNWSTLAPLRLPRPPARVQHQIADFLDDQVQWVARVIAAREAQLLLLREEREAEIDLSILGARGNARSVADLAVYQNGFPFKPSDFTEGGLPVVRIQQLNDPKAPCDLYGGPVPETNRIDSGDLIFSWSGSLSVGVWNRGAAILNQHLFKVTPRPGVDASWLRYALDAATRLFEPYMHGTGMTHITRPMMKAVRVPLPTEQDQRRVADLLGTREAIFDDHSRALRRSTSLMRELRTSLIAEVVLGEFDVSSTDGSRVRA